MALPWDRGKPARVTFAVTPHNTNALAEPADALYVGGGGNIVLRSPESGADTTFTAVPAGSILPVSCTHVRATGTTATGIVALA